MWDLRNKFLGHSSIEGTKVWLLPLEQRTCTNEMMTGYGHAVAKLHFLDSDTRLGCMRSWMLWRATRYRREFDCEGDW